MKKIPREMKICLWQNVLIVVNCTIKYVSRCFYEMLEDIIKIEKRTKKIFYFSS